MTENEEFEFRRRFEVEQSQTQPERPLSAGDVAIGAVTNFPRSFSNVVGDIYQAVTSPVETAQSLADLSAGALQNVLPNSVVNFVNQFDTNPEAAQRAVAVANSVGGFYKDRYGSVEGLKKSLANDPAGVMADMATLFTGGAAIAPKAASAPLRAAASIVDPLSLAGKAIAKTGNVVGAVVPPILGVRTGAGAEPIRQAFQAGKLGGESAEAFTANLRGKVDPTTVLADAKANLFELGRQRQQAYRANFENIKGDKSVLNFNGIDNAVKNAQDKVAFKGKIKNEAAAQKLSEVQAKIDEWKSLDPAEYHTPEGLDALKQSIGETLESIPFEAAQQRLVVGDVYNAVKKEINNQAPTYAKTMKAYSDATDEIRQIEKTLSTGNKATVDTAMRKLQSLMRDNVNTNYGQRLSLARTLEEKGGRQMLQALAGQALSSATPRGIQGGVAAPAAITAYSAGGIPAALLDALASSPRAMGELSYGTGATARGLLDVQRRLPELDYPTMFNLLYQSQQPKTE